MPSTHPSLWTVEEYYQLGTKDLLNHIERVELLEGQIFVTPPQCPLHAATTNWASDYLREILRGRAIIRTQLPVTLALNSKPEPDIAIVEIDVNRYVYHHPNPNEILLLIEIADVTLVCDRIFKALAYAKANILEYWVLDIHERQVHVFRQPTIDGYQQEFVVTDNLNFVAIAFPDIRITINQLFP